MKRNFLLLLLLLAISKVYSKQVLSDNDNGSSFFSKDRLELLNTVTSEDFFHKVLNKRDGDTFVKRELQSNKKFIRKMQLLRIASVSTRERSFQSLITNH